jgi:hypothetical protein
MCNELQIMHVYLSRKGLRYSYFAVCVIVKLQATFYIKYVHLFGI